MEYRNLTQFPSLAFEALDAQSQEFQVAVLRMTLEVRSDGMLAATEDQSPLLLADAYYGEINKSSVRQESDLSPYKPRCDVLLLGTAYAPGGLATKRFEAGLKMSKEGNILVDKRIAVMGPRYWRKRLLFGWKMTEPEPILSLPLRNELAYGGECRINRDDPAAPRVNKKYRLLPEGGAPHPDGPEKGPAAHTCCQANPVGRGYSEKWYRKAKRIRSFPAPQIENPSDPIREVGTQHTPASLGVVNKASKPRIDVAGTLDDAFIQSRKPLPDNFNFAYWNGAQSDMQIPWPAGGEEIELFNMYMAGTRERSRFVLPALNVCAQATYKSGEAIALDFNIDTLVIDADHHTVSLVYRLRLPNDPGMEALEVQVLTPEDRDVLREHCAEISRSVLAMKEAVHG